MSAEFHLNTVCCAIIILITHNYSCTYMYIHINYTQQAFQPSKNSDLLLYPSMIPTYYTQQARVVWFTSQTLMHP